MKPRLLDLFCGAGGAARGYQLAGFHVTGVDNVPQPRYAGDAFVQAEALGYLAEHGSEYDVIHASPPCQGYSIMNNLPWLRQRVYPLLILPTMEMLEALGKPYVLENVMGARHGAKGLRKRGLEAHGLKAGWLCGAMFGRPFYRHRLFATNWLWLTPEHPKHIYRIRPGSSMAGRARDFVFSPRPRGAWERGYQERHPGSSQQAALAAGDGRGLESWPGRRNEPAGLALAATVAATKQKRKGGALPHSSDAPGNTRVMTILDKWQHNGAQAVGVGHAKGWRLAAAAMEIDWMKRAELTQAIPPVYCEFVGAALLRELRA